MSARLAHFGVLLIGALGLSAPAHAWSPRSVAVAAIVRSVIVGPEVPVEPVEATDGGAVVPGDQRVPAIASDGTSALVVWEDHRNTAAPAIVGSRVSALGEVLDPAGITIAGGATTHLAPAIAFDGVNYLVVWSERRGADYGIFGARVTSAGVVLDVPGFAVNDASGDQVLPAVASNGSVSLVVWNGANGAFRDIWAVRIASGAAAPIESEPIEICAPAGLQEWSAASFGGGRFLVTWADERRGAGIRDVYAARVDPPSGTVLEPGGFAITTSGAAEYAYVAASQTEFLVGWSDQRLGWPKGWDLFAARVGFDGGVLDPEGVDVVSEDGMDFLTSIGFDGTHFLLNSHRSRAAGGEPFEAVTRRLTGTLQVVAPGQVALWGTDPDHTHYTPRMAMVGSTAILVWERTPWPVGGVGALEVFVSRLPTGASVIPEPPRLASTQAWSQSAGAIAATGGGWTVLWSDTRLGAEALRARWFGPGPVALGPSVPGTAPLDGGSGFSVSAVSASDGGVLAIWGRALDGGAALFSSFATRDGGSPARSVASYPGTHGGIAAASTDEGASVAWAVDTPSGTELQALSLDSAGAPLGTAEWQATNGGASPFDMNGTRDGTRSILAWGGASADAGGGSRVFWRSINAARGANELHGPVGVAGRVAGVAIDKARALALLAWTVNDDAGGTVHAMRLDGDGGALDSSPLTIAMEPALLGAPLAASHAGQVLMVWSRRTADAGWGIRGRVLPLAGAWSTDAGTSFEVLSGTELPSTDGGAPSLRLAMGDGPPAGGGDLLLLYERLVTGAGTPALQLMARSLSLVAPDGGAVGVDADGGAPGPDTGQGSVSHLRLGCDCTQTEGGALALAALLATFAARGGRRRRPPAGSRPLPARFTS